MLSHRSITTLVLALAAVAAPAAAAAQARTYRIVDNGGSRVQFVSDAPLEVITGVTSSLTGDVSVDVRNLAQARGRVAVAVGTLRTGVDMRDEHLRSANWLDATAHPQAVFEILGVQDATSLAPGAATRLRIRGRFTIHGVTREITANARVRYVPLTAEMREAHIDGDVLVVQTRFQIRLSDYGVSIPAAVRLKVSDTITVSVALRATATAAAGG